MSLDSQPEFPLVLWRPITPCPIISGHEELSLSPLQLLCKTILPHFSLPVWRLNKPYFWTLCSTVFFSIALIVLFVLLWTSTIGPVGKVSLGKRRKQMISWYTLRTKTGWIVRKESILKKLTPKPHPCPPLLWPRLAVHIHAASSPFTPAAVGFVSLFVAITLIPWNQSTCQRSGLFYKIKAYWNILRKTVVSFCKDTDLLLSQREKIKGESLTFDFPLECR